MQDFSQRSLTNNQSFPRATWKLLDIGKIFRLSSFKENNKLCSQTIMMSMKAYNTSLHW